MLWQKDSRTRMLASQTGVLREARNDYFDCRGVLIGFSLYALNYFSNRYCNVATTVLPLPNVLFTNVRDVRQTVLTKPKESET